MESSIQIHCKRCKIPFRDSAKRLQNGYSRQCPSCEIVLFFDEDSQDPYIKRAMIKARRARAKMREEEGPLAIARKKPALAVSRRFEGRLRVSERAD